MNEMTTQSRPYLIVTLGPTGSGKTKLVTKKQLRKLAASKKIKQTIRNKSK